MATKKVEVKKEEIKEEVKQVEEPTVMEMKADDTPTPFMLKLYNLQNDVAELAGNFISDGYNDNQSYEYVKASQYKTIFRQALAKNRLFHKVDDIMVQTGTDNLKSDKMALTQYHATLTIFDVDSAEKMTYMLWSQGADNLDKGLSKAKTMMLKDFVKSNYLISDKEDDPEAGTNTTTTKPKKTPKFTTPAMVQEAKKDVMSQKMATDQQKADIKLWIDGIREKSEDPTYGQKTLDTLDTLTHTKAVVKLTTLEQRGNEYGLEL